MSKKDKFVEKPWKEIKKLIITPEDDEDVCVYQDGMVMDDDGNIIGQIRGWNRSDPARLKKLSANIFEETDDEELDGPIDADFTVAKKRIDDLPEVEPKRVMRLPAPAPAPEAPKPAPAQAPEKPAQKTAPETSAAPRQDRKVRRARAGGFRLVNGEWVQG